MEIHLASSYAKLEHFHNALDYALERLGQSELSLMEAQYEALNNDKLNILSKSRYNVDLILVMYYISAGQNSLHQVQ